MRLIDMTWEEVRDLAGSAPIALLPAGAVEAHGPHLPLGTDVVIAEAMAASAERRLEGQGRIVLVLPPLVYTTARFAADFPGTISVDPDLVTRLAVGVARSIARLGASVLAIANAHLEPAHLQALSAAAEAIRGELGLPVAFPDLTRPPWALRLTDEFRSGACHAGCYEGSIVLAARGDLVRDSIRQALPDHPVSLARAIRSGKTTFREAGGERAYFGFPARASAEEGARTIEILGGILADAVAAEVAQRP